MRSIRDHWLQTTAAAWLQVAWIHIPSSPGFAVTTAETTYTFPTSAVPHLQFACHLPGHYAYGMHGTIVIR